MTYIKINETLLYTNHKVPKGLSEYGITSEEVEQMFFDFCREDSQINIFGSLTD